MESSRKDDRLSAALEALRPLPAPAFAAQLDESAAAGFPPHRASGATSWARLLAWARSLRPRQVLLPAAATGLVAVVVATAVVATSQSGSQPEGLSSVAGSEGGSNLLGDLNRFDSEGEVDSAAPEASAGAGASAGKAEAAESLAQPTEANVLPKSDSGSHRAVERSAQVVLGAAPEDLGSDAAKVFEAVHAAHGVVLSSSVHSGSEGSGAARFELLIPSAKLDDALGSISGIDEVLSRSDGSTDITAPTVGASERLQDARARIDSLLNELAASETEIERETIEGELASQRRYAAALRSVLGSLQRRASLSHVSVRIVGSDASAGSGGGWSFGDAAGDAGHILGVAAGVTLVGLAVLAPIALIALLFWLGWRAWVYYGRRRALG